MEPLLGRASPSKVVAQLVSFGGTDVEVTDDHGVLFGVIVG